MERTEITKPHVTKETIGAFWAKVNIRSPLECWEWTGARAPNGYGNVRVNCSYLKAHRFAWEITHFVVPRGLHVCHVCDNRACCNPSHLMLGSNRANFIDMVMKNRAQFRKNKAFGARNYNSKLNDEAVREIRNAYARKSANQYQLAEQYGVSQASIGSALHNRTWKHVNG